MSEVIMQQHFVTFASPGTFFAESTTKPIESWDVDLACQMAAEIVERYGARPYGFRFLTRGRTAEELDSKEIAKSPFYFINCRVETREEVETRNAHDENILRTNMRINDIKAVAVPKSGWKASLPISDGDIVLDFELSPLPAPPHSS